jgi:hypothetical protein
MGTGPSLLQPDTQEALRQSFFEHDESSPDVIDLLFNNRAVDELLANEPLANAESAENRGHSSEIAASIAETQTALNAGVRPRGTQSVVEQLMMELSLATATQSSHTRVLERRVLVLQALHAHMSSEYTAFTLELMFPGPPRSWFKPRALPPSLPASRRLPGLTVGWLWGSGRSVCFALPCTDLALTSTRSPHTCGMFRCNVRK